MDYKESVKNVCGMYNGICRIVCCINPEKDRPEYAVFVIVLTSLLLALRIMGVLETVMGELQQWDTLLGEKRQYVNLLLKLIGITYLCEFAANLCKDAGYGTLSNHIELFGKIMIMVSGLPVLKLMIEMLEDMMG